MLVDVKARDMLAAILLSALIVPGLVSAETVRALVNGAAEWKDTAGQPINCHCGGILVDGDTDWWYGEHRDATRAGHQCHTGIRCYSFVRRWREAFEVIEATARAPSPHGERII